MRLRLLGRDDGALLTRILGQFKGGGAAEPVEFLADPHTVVFVAEDDGDLVGWLYGYELTRPDGRRSMLLYEIGVTAEARGRGHGRALVEAILAEARSRNCSKAWVLADSSNVAAEALYKNAGAQKSPQGMYTWNLESA